MNCPQCNQKLVCGCSACLVNFPAKENEKAMGFLPDGECQACPNCGFTLHADGWLDVEIKQLKEQGIWPLHREKK
jgi:hypothetical protein